MKTILRILGLLIVALALYLCFWPVSIDPVAWTPPTNPGFTGIYEANDILAKVERLYDGECDKCEDVAVDSQFVYGGSESGEIYKFDKEGNRTILANTGGRPLGLIFDADHNLIVGDAHKGLLSISPEGKITTLATEHNGVPFKFTDDLDIDSSGVIYFTDASHKFGIEQFTDDLMEHRPNGRFLSYDPATKTTKLLIDSMYFANGVALSPDESFVLINETSKYRILRYWLKGERAGTKDIFIDNLPGFPDGVLSDRRETIWVALISPRTEDLEKIMPKPFMRKLVMRLPKSMHPAPEKFSCVLGLDVEGKVVYNLQDSNGTFTSITNVVDFDNHLYFGTLVDNGIGRIALSEFQ